MARKVQALKDGFYAGVRRRPGDVFEISDNTKLGKWMVEVTDIPVYQSARKDVSGEEPAPAPAKAKVKAQKGDGSEEPTAV